MWEYLAGPFLASGTLLLVAGLPKLRDPMPLVRAMRSADLPTSRALVRVAAAAEVAVGVGAVVAPGRLSAGLVAVAYVGFTGFVILVLRRGGVLGSCGCFGTSDTRPSRTHAVLTGAAAVVAASVAVAPPVDPWSRSLTDSGLLGAAVLLIAFLAWQVMAVLPGATSEAARSTGRHPTDAAAEGV